MAIISACTLDPGVYFSMNMKGDPAVTAAKVTSMNFPVTVEHMDDLAKQIGEKTLFGRVGGAPTLAVGMAGIFSGVFRGNGLGLWYHFAIMFEALFILTTLDAGTRVGRYLLQDFLGHLWKPLGDTKNLTANAFASAAIVAAWGWFLIQGVRDPLGGINSLWPLFGIANQMLAAIALCLAVTIILKMQLLPATESKAESPKPKVGRPAFALVALVPLVWLLAATMTGGVEKIWHPDPSIGFLSQAKVIEKQLLDMQLDHARTMHNMLVGTNNTGAVISESLIEKINKDPALAAMAKQRTLRFNLLLDAAVAGAFLVLISAIIVMSVRDWILLLARKKAVDLRESPPTWLPDYTMAQSSPLNAVALIALAFALVKELSGQADVDRAQARHACACEQRNDVRIYTQVTDERFKGVRRCC